MQNINLTRLNELSEKLKFQFNLSQMRFYVGNLLDKTARACSELCPYSKIVCLYTEQGFFTLGEEFTNVITSYGLTPINLILGDMEREKDQITSSLPENARLIVTIDEKHIYNAQTLAKDMGLTCVVGLSSMPERLFNMLNPPPTAFIIDRNLKVDESFCYQLIVNRIISLLDIKLKQFFRIIVGNFEIVYDFIEILDNALSVYKEEPLTFRQKLVEYAFQLELIEISLGHSFYPFAFKTALCIIKLIAGNLTKEYYKAPNYIERAKVVSERYDRDYLQTLKSFKFQIERQKEFKDKLFDIKRGISALAQIYADKTPLIIKTYKSLGGHLAVKEVLSANDVLQQVKYAGDIHYYNNSMALLRETGCLEQIK